MLALETKKSGGKLLSHSDLQVGVFLGETTCSIQREMKIGTWNVRSLYMAGSFKAATMELARYKLIYSGCAGGQVGQRGHSKSRGLWFLRERKWKSSIGNRFFVHHRIVSAVKRVEFVSDRLSYTVLRGRWRNIIVVNVHAPSEEKSDESKDSFNEELE